MDRLGTGLTSLRRFFISMLRAGVVFLKDATTTTLDYRLILIQKGIGGRKAKEEKREKEGRKGRGWMETFPNHDKVHL